MPKFLMPGEITCKTALTKTGIPGFRYCLNPYVGCTHGCVYCYASFMCRFSGHNEPWGEFVDAKVNFAGVLEDQLRRSRRMQEGRLLLGSVTDVYQQAEARYGLTRSCLEALVRYPSLDVEILTKSALVVRDLSLLQKFNRCSVGFTVTALSEKETRVLEPGAPPPGLRLAAARQLSEAGIPVWVFIAPVLPGLGDSGEALTGLFRSLKKAGVKTVMADFLNPYPAVVQRLKNIYRRKFPDALAELELYLMNREFYHDNMLRILSGLSGQFGCEISFV